MAEFIDRRNDVLDGALADSRADKFGSYQIADFPLPTGREEEWRFTPVDTLAPVLADELGGAQPSVVVNGHAVTKDGAVSLGGATVIIEPHVGRETARVGQPTDRVAAVSWNNAPQMLKVLVDKEAELNEALVVDICGADLAAAGHYLLVEVGAQAQADIVLKYHGDLALAQTVEVLIGEGAKVNLVSVHDASDESLHAATHRMSVAKDAEFKHVVVTLGGKAVRVIPELEFAGEHAEVELLGLYITGTGQHHEHRLFVHHNLPNCVSNVTYKGALHGENCHGVWIGDVLIGPAADGTDSYEQNRNLLLNLGPKVDSVPNLEIANGNIEGAGHASATMRFDEDQLFYLRSRGISEVEARRMVVHGFFAELINQIGIADLEAELLEKIEKELSEGGH